VLGSKYLTTWKGCHYIILLPSDLFKNRLESCSAVFCVKNFSSHFYRKISVRNE